MEKIKNFIQLIVKNKKKIAKYVLNVLTILNAIILGINAVEGIAIPYCTQITGVISVVMGVISTYLLGNKAVATAKSKKGSE